MHAWRITIIIAAILVWLGLGTGGWYVNKGLQHFRSADRSMTVKGVAEQTVKSDYVVWSLKFQRAGNDIVLVREAITKDRNAVLTFLKHHGFTTEEIEVQPIYVQDMLAREWSSENVPLRYHGKSFITIKTARVDQVAATNNQLEELIQSGVQLAIDENDGPSYQLRGFNEVKATLLEAATKNAVEQATKFAQDAGSRLGKLNNANQGVVRMLDDDGEDNESGRTINKRLRVVSTFTFGLE
jgi:hypothetical protein